MQSISPEKKPIADHLNDLRKGIFFSVWSVFLAAIGAYIASDKILNWITGPIRHLGQELYFFAPTDAFLVKLKIAVISGLIIGSPVIISQIWLYVAPGLYPKERKALIPCIASTIVLFVIGASFSFTCVVPIALHFLMGFGNAYLSPMISISHYVSFIGSLIIAFGLAFNLPVVLVLLIKMKLITVKQLSSMRRHAYVGSFILSMLLTPPDVISQSLLAGPLIILYEISCVVGSIIERRSKNN